MSVFLISDYLEEPFSSIGEVLPARSGHGIFSSQVTDSPVSYRRKLRSADGGRGRVAIYSFRGDGGKQVSPSVRQSVSQSVSQSVGQTEILQLRECLEESRRSCHSFTRAVAPRHLPTGLNR